MEGFHFTFIITICLCSMPVSSLFRDSPLPTPPPLPPPPPPPPLWDKYLFPFSLVSFLSSPLLLSPSPSLPLTPIFVLYPCPVSLWGK